MVKRREREQRLRQAGLVPRVSNQPPDIGAVELLDRLVDPLLGRGEHSDDGARLEEGLGSSISDPAAALSAVPAEAQRRRGEAKPYPAEPPTTAIRFPTSLSASFPIAIAELLRCRPVCVQVGEDDGLSRGCAYG